MPWMLLRKVDPPLGEDESPRVERAWILVGGLEHTLQQSGMIPVLLDRRLTPNHVIAAGFAVVNAVLLGAGVPARFERSWERLREKHFLPVSALCGNRVLGSLNGLFDELVADLADSVQSGPAATRHPQTLVAVDEAFVRLPLDPSDAQWRASMKQTLRQASAANPPLVAAAIREAANLAGDILVFGVERTTQAHPDVEAATRSAAATGVNVAFLTAATPRKIGLLQYLLPGSGAPERLQIEGYGSVSRWLRVNGGNGTRTAGGHSPEASPPFGMGCESPEGFLPDS